MKELDLLEYASQTSQLYRIIGRTRESNSFNRGTNLGVKIFHKTKDYSQTFVRCSLSILKEHYGVRIVPRYAYEVAIGILSLPKEYC